MCPCRFIVLQVTIPTSTTPYSVYRDNMNRLKALGFKPHVKHEVVRYSRTVNGVETTVYREEPVRNRKRTGASLLEPLPQLAPQTDLGYQLDRRVRMVNGIEESYYVPVPIDIQASTSTSKPADPKVQLERRVRKVPGGEEVSYVEVPHTLPNNLINVQQEEHVLQFDVEHNIPIPVEDNAPINEEGSFLKLSYSNCCVYIYICYYLCRHN